MTAQSTMMALTGSTVARLADGLGGGISSGPFGQSGATIALGRPDRLTKFEPERNPAAGLG